MHIISRTVALAAAVGLIATGASAREFPTGSPDFKTDYTGAVRLAKKSGKPLLLVFSASWCGPCQDNKNFVYPSEAVKAYHDKFVWVYLDTDQRANAQIARQFRVRGIPHIQFVDPGGRPIDKTVGGTTPRRFAATLKGLLRTTGSGA